MKNDGRKIANPAHPQGTPIEISTRTEGPISDRGNRYRANQVFDQLPAAVRNRCHFCGRTAMAVKMMAAHVDGFEENNDPSNISTTCRSCNSVTAANFARNNVGRRTVQYNPAQAIRSADAYLQAIEVLKASDDSEEIHHAIARIQATSHHDRTAFAREMSKAKHSPKT